MDKVKIYLKEHPQDIAMGIVIFFIYSSQARWFPFDWPISLGISLTGLIGVTFILFRSFWWLEKLVLFGMYCHFIYATLDNFAQKYMDLDLLKNGIPFTPTEAEAWYFSIVTFTTLGYGDYQPSIAARVWAQSEALLGYVLLGLMVALCIKVFEPLPIKKD